MLVEPRLYQQTTLLPVRASHTALGTMGELLVARLLTERGYRLLKSHKHGDLTVSDPDGVIINVEVKTARRGSQGWQFCIRKTGHTDCAHADWVILLAVQDSGRPIPFVVPSNELTAKCVVFKTPPTRYAGRLAKFRQPLESIKLGD